MCGISGIINLDNTLVQEKNIRTMMLKMKHRGPDDDGVYIENNVGLGFVRLSILDLSLAGHQPMHSKDGRYVLIFNGEIYNYIEIRDELKDKYLFTTGTDSEVILAAYHEWGDEFLNRLNGMFAIVIHDKKTNRIFGARDRFGIKPFYYYFDGNQFIFASEIDPIINVMPVPVSPNLESVYHFLVHNRTDYSKKTFFNEISKVGKGECFHIDSNGLVFEKWYDLETEVNKSKGLKSTSEFREMFVDSVRLRMRADVPVGVCLSGGLDSSTIVKVISDILKHKNVNSFSAIYKKGQKGDESHFIESLKRNPEISHFIKLNEKNFLDDIDDLLKIHAEPFPGTAVYSQYKVMQLANNKSTVLLDGQGADEYLAGYSYFYGVYYKELIKKLKFKTLFKEVYYYLKLYKNLNSIISTIFYFLPSSIRNKLENKKRGDYIDKRLLKAYSKNDFIANKLHGSNGLKMSLINHFNYKMEHLLKWEDLNSMAFSIESRVPFLDYRVVEKTIASTNDFKISSGFTKKVLRDSFIDILPKEIYNRKDKIGFLNPRDEWFKNPEIIKRFKEVFTSPNFNKYKFVDSEQFQRIYSSFLNGKKDYSKEIWKVYVLQKWFDKYF